MHQKFVAVVIVVSNVRVVKVVDVMFVMKAFNFSHDLVMIILFVSFV